MVVKKRPKPLLFVIFFFLLLIICLGASWWYFTSPVNRSSKENIEVVITSGMNTSQIGKLLEKNNLIRSEKFFKIYIKINNISSLKASTYILSKNMGLREIVSNFE